MIDEVLKELVSDGDVEDAFAHTDYGDTPPREVIRLGLLKTAAGFANGLTTRCVLVELGLINHNTLDLTSKGRLYLWSSWAGTEGETK